MAKQLIIFTCVSSENDFKVGFNGGDKESNNAG